MSRFGRRRNRGRLTVRSLHEHLDAQADPRGEILTRGADGRTYVEGADDFGGVVRYYEVPELVRVAAPIHLKFTMRNAPSLYPAGEHIAAQAVASARERVRRAALALALLSRYSV